MTCLVLIFTFNSQNTSFAVPVGGIVKSFKGLGKIFNKNIDEVPDLTKNADELSNTKNIDNGINNSSNSIDNSSISQTSDQLSSFDINQVLTIKKSEIIDVLNDHGLNNVNNLIDSINIDDFFKSNNEDIDIFRIIFWTGRVFRVSNIFNKPKQEDRLVINCNTDINTFYFTAILEKKKKWLLLSNNTIDTKKLGYYSPSLKRQNLYVLQDIESYIIFSTQTIEGKKFPNNYFIISKNGTFVHEKNTNGTESPNIIINNAENKILNSNYKCNKM